MQVEVQVGTRRSAHHAENQDRAVVAGTVIDHATSVVSEHLDGPSLVAVLDGLGGHPAGDVASQLAGEELAAAEVPTDESATSALLERTDRMVHDASARDARRAGMGTTAALVALGADGGECLVANVGDSSVWRLTGDALEELSASDRAFGSTILQCLGANDLGITPHVRRVELTTGDRLLLASDGLTDVVPMDEVATMLRDDPAHAVERLMRRVVDAGPPDDVTIVLLDVVSA